MYVLSSDVYVLIYTINLCIYLSVKPRKIYHVDNKVSSYLILSYDVQSLCYVFRPMCDILLITDKRDRTIQPLRKLLRGLREARATIYGG